MKILRRLFEKRDDAYDRYWKKVAPVMNSAGVTVSPDTAESISAVYAAVSAISESVGSLPLDVYRRTAEGREKARSHPLYALLHDAPNDYQTALEMREQMQRHVLLRGNAYAEVIRGGNGRPQALLPIHPDRVSILRTQAGKLLYDVSDDYGNQRRLLADEVLHIRYHSDDGILGRSPIQVARDTVGLALAERTHGAKMFEQGTKLSGVIQTQPGTTREQSAQIAQSWSAGQEGVGNHGKTAVLPHAAEFKTVSMTLEDAEWIEARRMSVEEVARLFRVPPVLIGDLREANYSNAVELGRYFVTHTLRRHLVAWEQAINRVLINDPALFYVEHNTDALLRGDSLTRAQFYQRGIEDGWMLRSEVRAKENLSKIEGIDDDAANAQAESARDGHTAGRVEEGQKEGATR